MESQKQNKSGHNSFRGKQQQGGKPKQQGGKPKQQGGKPKQQGGKPKQQGGKPKQEQQQPKHKQQQQQPKHKQEQQQPKHKQQQQQPKHKQEQQQPKHKQEQQQPKHKQEQQQPKHKQEQQQPKHKQEQQQHKPKQQNINIPKKEVVSEPKIYEILEEEEPKKVIQPPKQETSFRSFFDTLSDLLNDEVVEETKENSISETSSDFVIISCKKKWKKVLVRIVVKYEEKIDFELHKKNPKEGRDSNIINFKGKKSRVKKIKRKILEILNE
jgi:hypothetical protein